VKPVVLTSNIGTIGGPAKLLDAHHDSVDELRITMIVVEDNNDRFGAKRSDPTPRTVSCVLYSLCLVRQFHVSLIIMRQARRESTCREQTPGQLIAKSWRMPLCLFSFG
jgi:hypothetical protein